MAKLWRRRSVVLRLCCSRAFKPCPAREPPARRHTCCAWALFRRLSWPPVLRRAAHHRLRVHWLRRRRLPGLPVLRRAAHRGESLSMNTHRARRFGLLSILLPRLRSVLPCCSHQAAAHCRYASAAKRNSRPVLAMFSAFWSPAGGNLTSRSSGRPPASCACLRSPLNSNVSLLRFWVGVVLLSK